MKTLLKIILGLVVLLIVALVAGYFFLGTIVKSGVEKVGPRVTKTDVKLKGATLSVFSGSGELKGFVIGNPEGYKSPSAIQVGSVAVNVKPGSVMSDKVVVHSIRMESPEITFEGTLGGNNLGKLLDNIKGSSESDKQTTSKDQKSSAKKLQVDDFLLTGAKVHVSTSLLGGGAATLSIPDIHMTNLGEGKDGITAAELGEKVFAQIFQSTIAAVTAQVGNLGKGATDLIKGAGTNTAPALEKATKGIGDLFKKK
jgi:uncharacterized protein involved in outer membrane biogenesis